MNFIKVVRRQHQHKKHKMGMELLKNKLLSNPYLKMHHLQYLLVQTQEIKI